MRQSNFHKRRGGISGLAIISLASFVVVVLLLYFLLTGRSIDHAADLKVFCAAGIRPPVEAAKTRYESEFGVKIDLQTASSGALLNQIKQYPKGDLYIPADVFFVGLARQDELIVETIPLAQFRLCIAVAPGNPKRIQGLDDLFRGNLTYSIPNEEAAAGHKAQDALEPVGLWAMVKKKAKTQKPTVTEVAGDVQLGAVDAGIVWDSTARQFGLDVVYIPQFQRSESQISASVLTASQKPTEALRFARYLAAPQKGQPLFKEHYFLPIEGDPWAVQPEITIYSGGVNRPAVQKTIEEFEKREGVKVNIVWAGCGQLVAQMKAGQWPDMYFACDVSFSSQVQDRFERFHDVSKMRMMILVPPGNPNHIQSLSDLTRPGLKIGRADEILSALGALTKTLLIENGVYDAVARNTKVSTPTAAELVSQLVLGDQLDAAIVYEANAIAVVEEGKAELIPIEDDKAIAIQPVAVRKGTKYPQLMHRLIDRIYSNLSKQRFERVGFEWLAGDHQESDRIK